MIVIAGGMFLKYNKVLAECCIIVSPSGIDCDFYTDDCGKRNGTIDPNDCLYIDKCNSNSANTSKTNTTGTSTEFINPIGFKTVSELLNAVLNKLMGIIAIVSVIFIVIGGIMYMMSTGNEEMVKRAKKTWTGAVIGLAIALAAPTFLKEIQSILGGSSGTGGSAATWVASGLTIKDIAVNVLNFLLSVVGIIAIIAMVIGGGMYLTAYGDEKRIDKAKSIITYAIIGIVVTLASLVIIRQVDNILRGTGSSSPVSTPTGYTPPEGQKTDADAILDGVDKIDGSDYTEPVEKLSPRVGTGKCAGKTGSELEKCELDIGDVGL